MDSRSHRSAGRDAQRVQVNRDELVERISRATREERRVEPLKGLYLIRHSSPAEIVYTLANPSFCVIAQGSKEIFLGRERYQYDPCHYLLTTAELPLVGHAIDASNERPYLSFRLELDAALIGSVMVEAGHPASQDQTDLRAIAVSSLDAGLLDAVVRLVRLLDTPAEAGFLATLITREIVYRLWRGELRDRLRHIAVVGGYTPPIAKAIERLRKNFDQPLRIDDIAREIGMSVSGFHHHFKAVTAMSPLQFQKHLRLQEARRLMLGQGLDAASAGYRVGYNDASHFSREYKRLFGVPPIRDVERLREVAEKSAGRRAVFERVKGDGYAP